MLGQWAWTHTTVLDRAEGVEQLLGALEALCVDLCNGCVELVVDGVVPAALRNSLTCCMRPFGFEQPFARGKAELRVVDDEVGYFILAVLPTSYGDTCWGSCTNTTPTKTPTASSKVPLQHGDAEMREKGRR